LKKRMNDIEVGPASQTGAAASCCGAFAFLYRMAPRLVPPNS